MLKKNQVELAKRIVAEKRKHGKQLEDLIRKVEYEEYKLKKEAMQPPRRKPDRTKIMMEVIE